MSVAATVAPELGYSLGLVRRTIAVNAECGMVVTLRPCEEIDFARGIKTLLNLRQSRGVWGGRTGCGRTFRHPASHASRSLDPQGQALRMTSLAHQHPSKVHHVVSQRLPQGYAPDHRYHATPRPLEWKTFRHPCREEVVWPWLPVYPGCQGYFFTSSQNDNRVTLIVSCRGRKSGTESITA